MLIFFGRGGNAKTLVERLSQMTENIEEKLSVPNPSVP